MKIKELIDFIAYAKKKGYADPNSVWKKTKDGGEKCEVKKGDFNYDDTYFGGITDSGQERVSYKGKVVWIMAYRGGSLNENLSDEAFNFLKECINKIPKDFPARGPKKVTKGKWVYENKWEGNILGFVGRENIFYGNKKICFRNYLGGLIKNKE
ncbi:MAG: hypothetical protein KKF67_03420 [Nanoarchaeota archaeon]|nr:hypothetical protein [Nanoarchaeota archaeon]